MLEKFTVIRGKAVPLRGEDIDTDRILPARFMKVLTFEGLGQYLFYDERFDEKGNPKPHPLQAGRHLSGRGAGPLLRGAVGRDGEHAAPLAERSPLPGGHDPLGGVGLRLRL